MAIRFDLATERIRRTTNIPSFDANYTFMAWVYVTTHNGTGNGACVFSIDDQVNDVDEFYLDAPNGTNLRLGMVTLNNGSATGSTGTTTFTAGTWQHVCLVRSANNLRTGYLNGTSDLTHTTNVSGRTAPTMLSVGSVLDDDLLNGRIACIKIWTAALTAAEIQQEIGTIRPVRVANLDTWTPGFLHTDINDYSGNGFNWTAVGTLTTEDGPPVSWGGQRPISYPFIYVGVSYDSALSLGLSANQAQTTALTAGASVTLATAAGIADGGLLDVQAAQNLSSTLGLTTSGDLAVLGSARISGSGDMLSTSSPLQPNASFTVCGVAKLASTSASFQNLFGIEESDTSSDDFVNFGFMPGNSVMNLTVTSGGAAVFSDNLASAPEVGQWFFWFVKLDASTSPDTWTAGWGSANGPWVTFSDTADVAWTATFMALGNNSYNEWTDINISYVKAWSAHLSEAQLRAEMVSSLAVLPTNLWAYWPLYSDADDDSGNARDLTETGILWQPGPLPSDKLINNPSNPMVLNDEIYDGTKAGPRTVFWVNATDAWMLYEAANDEGTITSIAYASSTDGGVTWTKYGSNPVLSPTETWENDEIAPTSVFWDSSLSKYVLYYHGGGNSPSVRKIGFATADDPTGPWTKYASNPVMEPGSSGAWDDKFVADAKVIKVDSTYHMWYYGVKTSNDLGQVGHATSSDGISWTKDGANPVLASAASGWDSGDIQSPGVHYDGTTYHMWYAGDDGDDGNEALGYAYSEDGTTWTRGPSNPVLTKPGEANIYIGDTVDVYYESGKWHVLYGYFDFNGTPIRAIYEATALVPTEISAASYDSSLSLALGLAIAQSATLTVEAAATFATGVGIADGTLLDVTAASTLNQILGLAADSGLSVDDTLAFALSLLVQNGAANDASGSVSLLLSLLAQQSAVIDADASLALASVLEIQQAAQAAISLILETFAVELEQAQSADASLDLSLESLDAILGDEQSIDLSLTGDVSLAQSLGQLAASELDAGAEIDLPLVLTVAFNGSMAGSNYEATLTLEQIQSLQAGASIEAGEALSLSAILNVTTDASMDAAASISLPLQVAYTGDTQLDAQSALFASMLLAQSATTQAVLNGETNLGLVHALTMLGGQAIFASLFQQMSLGLSIGSAVFVVSTETPDCRQIVVSLEIRTASVAVESRFMAVAAETRLATVPTESRYMEVPQESRVITIISC